LTKACQQVITDIKAAGTYKTERVISSAQDMRIIANGQNVLNFCANNYLGLANHPRVVESAKKTLDERGFGMASVRFICGTQDIHKELESKISNFHKVDDAIIYPSCFDANAGFFEAVMTSEDAIISDELNHASIIDGVRLSKSKRFRYKHMNMENLEKSL
jgi:glycine C-acetyltransferase